jgi:NADPH-dependent 7-cyano-7-deazaguanine reductase QueF
MDIKQLSNDLVNEISSKKKYLETFKNVPTKDEKKVEKVEPKKED